MQLLALVLAAMLAGNYDEYLSYADDIVLLATSWCAIRDLIVILEDSINNIDMCCYTDETGCMVFLTQICKIVTSHFPDLIINGQLLQYVLSSAISVI